MGSASRRTGNVSLRQRRERHVETTLSISGIGLRLQSEESTERSLQQDLSALRSRPINLHILKQTGIAKIVKALQRHCSTAIATLATELVSDWKRIAAAEIRAQVVRQTWYTNLTVGTKCLCAFEGQEHTVKIVAMYRYRQTSIPVGLVKIHYVGWHKSWDEWIPRNSPR